MCICKYQAAYLKMISKFFIKDQSTLGREYSSRRSRLYHIQGMQNPCTHDICMYTVSAQCTHAHRSAGTLGPFHLTKVQMYKLFRTKQRVHIWQHSLSRTSSSILRITRNDVKEFSATRMCAVTGGWSFRVIQCARFWNSRISCAHYIHYIALYTWSRGSVVSTFVHRRVCRESHTERRAV